MADVAATNAPNVPNDQPSIAPVTVATPVVIVTPSQVQPDTQPPTQPQAVASPAAPPTLSPAAQARLERQQEAHAALAAPLVAMAVELPTQPPPPPVSTTAPEPDLWLLPGMSIDATLYTSIDTDTPTAGTIVAYLKPPGLYDSTHRHLIAPAYSKLIGGYGNGGGFEITQNSTHLPAQFYAIQTDDRIIALGGQPGIDPTGTTGLGATANHHTAAAIKDLVIVTALGALLNRGGGGGGYGGTTTGAAVVQAAQQILPPTGARQVTLHVAEGAAIGVMVTQPIKVQEYHQ